MFRTIYRSLFAAVAALALLAPASALALNSVQYTGQGLLADGFGGYDLVTEICAVTDANGNIIPDAYGNVADTTGPYLLWVLTANGATSANIAGPWGNAAMTKSGNGTFKYVSAWYDPSTLPGNVSATYDGKAKNAQLVISHGCRPYNREGGAWCSPGFFRNATDNAWALTGYTRSDLFNLTVVPNFYDTTSVADPTLNTVLTTPGANTFGAASAPYGLNAFNATGAFLTDNIPGYAFDFALIAIAGDDDSATCPIDHDGNYKVPQ